MGWINWEPELEPIGDYTPGEDAVTFDERVKEAFATLDQDARNAQYAEAEELLEDGDVVDAGDVGEKGMPATNPRVRSLLAAHPREFVTICVAGCRGKPSIVQILPMPATARAGAMRTTAGSMGSPQKGRPDNAAGLAAADANAITCVAGCGGRQNLSIE